MTSDRSDAQEAIVQEEYSCENTTSKDFYSNFLWLEVGDKLNVTQLDSDGKEVGTSTRELMVESRVVGSSASGLAHAGDETQGLTEGDKAHLIKHNGDDIFTKYTLEDRVCEVNSKYLISLNSRGSESKFDKKRLDEIRKYQRLANKTKELTKRVKFSYASTLEDELAPGVPNHEISGRGKLTLEKVELGNSRAFFKPFEFSYYKKGLAAPYHKDHFDKWGFYNSQGGTEFGLPGAKDGETMVMLNHEVNPDDVNAWSIKGIKQPSGGEVLIDYESDSYGYVGRQRVGMDILAKFEGEPGEPKSFRMFSKEKAHNNTTELINTQRIFDFNELKTMQFEDKSPLSMRVASVFRLYRPVSGAVKTQMNPVFKEYFDASEEEKKNLSIHLVATFDQGWLNVQNGVLGNEGQCGAGPSNGNLLGSGPLEVPIDLGELDMSQFEFADNEGDAPNDLLCQTAFIDFELSKLQHKNLEWKNYAEECVVTGHYNEANAPWIETIEGYKIPKYYRLKWVVLRNQDLLADNTTPEYKKEWKVQRLFGEVADLGQEPYLYDENGEKKGLGRWKPLTEHLEVNSDSYEENTEPFREGYWDFEAFQIYKAVIPNESPQFAGGVLGGGLRVKNIAYNSGWNRNKENEQGYFVTDYDYDCAASEGGTFSSGATGSEPPPFNGQYDTRVKQDGEVSLTRNSPGVTYRTVTESKRGEGKTVYDFVTTADVSDYVGLTRYGIRTTKVKKVKLSSLLGMNYKIRKFNEAGELLSQERKVYGIGIQQSIINSVNKLSAKNGSDANALTEAVVSTSGVIQNDVSGETIFNPKTHFSGPSYFESGTDKGEINQVGFTLNNDNLEQGSAVQRYDMIWYDDQDFLRVSGAANCSQAEKRCAKDLNSKVLVEELEPRVSLVKSISEERGVGLETRFDYFDFMSGEPLVTVVRDKKRTSQSNDTRSKYDYRVDSVSQVSVPAYWVYNEFDANKKFGSVFQDPNWIKVTAGEMDYSALKFNNDLTSKYSNSTYVNMPAIESDDSDPDNTGLANWRGQLGSSKLVKRDFFFYMLNDNEENFELSGQVNSEKWIPNVSYHLRVPLKLDPTSHDLVSDIPDGEFHLLPTAPPEDVIASSDYVMGDNISLFNKAFEMALSTNANGLEQSTLYDENDRVSAVVLGAAGENVTIESFEENIDRVSGGLMGETSYELSADGELDITPNSILQGVDYQLVVFIRANKESNLSVYLDGNLITGVGDYKVENPEEWQLIYTSLNAEDLNGINSIKIVTDNGMKVDNIRLMPMGSRATTFAYDNKGRLKEKAAINHSITRYYYDKYDRLMETRDHQGLIMGSQSQKEVQ